MQKLDNIMGKGESGDDSLHVALSLLQTIGEFLLILEDTDAVLTSQLKSWAKKLEQPDSSAAKCKTLFLETQAVQRLDSLLKNLDQSKRCVSTGLIEIDTHLSH